MKKLTAFILVMLFVITSCHRRAGCAKKYNKTTWMPHKAKLKHKSYAGSPRR